MINHSDLRRLLAATDVEPSVLSLYVRVPMDPAELRELPARVDQMLDFAVGTASAHDAALALPGDQEQVSKLAEIHGREWLGHTAAIFVASRVGLSEAFALPCELPDRAVIAVRPHVRPLLVALQRCPAHLVVIVDRRHAWLLRVTGDRVEASATISEAEQVRSPGFGGWYGLDSAAVNDRIMELAHEHFLGTAELLSRVSRQHEHDHEREPLVVGGHSATIPQFMSVLPEEMRDRVAGTFIVDPHTMTPARVRALARPIVDAWVRDHERRLGIDLRQREGLWLERPPAFERSVGFERFGAGAEPGAGVGPGTGVGRGGAAAGPEAAAAEKRGVRAEAERAVGGAMDAAEAAESVRMVAPSAARTVAGLGSCLVAVNQRAVGLLVVPVGGVVGGFACRRCGTLSATGADCVHGQAGSRWVPDLFEEMAVSTIENGGRVAAIADPPGDVAARLRFPVS